MHRLLDPTVLLRRMEIYLAEEAHAGRVPERAFPILREVLLTGEIERGRAPALTGYQERAARMVVARLLELKLLKSASPRAALRLGFPIDIIERWFPLLYPMV